MTNEQLRSLIAGDATASALAAEASDAACAVRCMEIAPWEPGPRLIGELGVLDLFEDPEDGETVMQKLEAVAQSNALVARALKWMQPLAPGLPIGKVSVRTMLDQLHAAGVFTDVEHATLKRAGEQPAVITAAMVGSAR